MKKMSKLIRDRYVWYIAVLLGMVTIFTYIVEPKLFSKTFEESEWHAISVIIRNLIFLSVVTISTWKFGLRRGLAICVAIGFIPIPHIVDETLVEEYHPGVFLEYMIFIPIGVFIAWLVGARKQMEETLRLQSELLDKELDSVYLTDFEGNFLYVNRAAYVTHGYTREELLNMTLKKSG